MCGWFDFLKYFYTYKQLLLAQCFSVNRVMLCALTTLLEVTVPTFHSFCLQGNNVLLRVLLNSYLVVQWCYERMFFMYIFVLGFVCVDMLQRYWLRKHLLLPVSLLVMLFLFFYNCVHQVSEDNVTTAYLCYKCLALSLVQLIPILFICNIFEFLQWLCFLWSFLVRLVGV